MRPKTKTDSLAAFCQLWGNTSQAGGYLVMTMDGVESAVFNEQPGQPLEPPPEASLPMHLTWCSQPLYGTLDAGPVWAWAEYHRVYANVSRFIFYDMAAWSPGLTALFAPYFAAGMAAVTDMSGGRRFGFHAGEGALSFITKHQVGNDCIHRSLFTSRWVTLHDTDEYLSPVPPHSLHVLLAAHAHAPWLSHGALVVEPSVCQGEAQVVPGTAVLQTAGGLAAAAGGASETSNRSLEPALFEAPQKTSNRSLEPAPGTAGNGTQDGEMQWDEAAVEEAKRRAVELLSRLVFRRPDVWCVRGGAEEQRIESDLCGNWRGHRKLILNPRKTEVVSIHEAREPQKDGVVLNAATELRHFHLSGVVNPVNVRCQTLVPPGEDHVWFVRDTTIADQIRLLGNASAPQPEP
ncbi:unnamed protein product [Closterium sp. NIES-64]|nr:unnamed protein product [Closterium sp. NIES-64]